MGVLAEASLRPTTRQPSGISPSRGVRARCTVQGVPARHGRASWQFHIISNQGLAPDHRSGHVHLFLFSFKVPFLQCSAMPPLVGLNGAGTPPETMCTIQVYAAGQSRRLCPSARLPTIWQAASCCLCSSGPVGACICMLGSRRIRSGGPVSTSELHPMLLQSRGGSLGPAGDLPTAGARAGQGATPF